MTSQLLTAIFLFLSLSEKVIAQSYDCKEDGVTKFYLEVPLKSENQNAHKLHFYFQLTAPFDSNKPTLLIIPGGPGGHSGHAMPLLLQTPLTSYANVVTFDHRGVGCTYHLPQDLVYYDNDINSMSRAADDLEALRKHLLGEHGEWIVYGESYGGMLAQKYMEKYPDNIADVILDSTSHSTEMMEIARRKFKKLFLASNLRTKIAFKKTVYKYPSLQDDILSFGNSYLKKQQGREKLLPDALEDILDSPTLELAREKVEKIKARPDVSIWVNPTGGMVREIICREMWDFPKLNRSENGYFWPGFAYDCLSYSNLRTPMDFSSMLEKYPKRVLLMGGTIDATLPIESMRIMHKKLANSLFFESKTSGHGIIFEKPKCAFSIIISSLQRASTASIADLINSPECQTSNIILP